ncbi:MAG: hypothetical protein CSA34_02355 [Desulfobulbus propionicus]|nr:MAG: hypothetical protein CSA34_02355 [Desulfobulbus propionicus]
MRYTLQLTEAAATIGYLACEPEADLADGDAVRYLARHPLDDFMHRYLLGRVLAMPVEAVERFAREFAAMPVIAPLLAEAALQRDDLDVPALTPLSLAKTPLVDLAQEGFADMALHRAWSRRFADNILNHAELADPQTWPPLPYPAETIAAAGRDIVPVTRFSDAAQHACQDSSRTQGASPEEASCRARQALAAAGVRLDRQMLHQMSLAPVGLVRNWGMEIRVENGCLGYVLSGTQTSFGRGTEFEAAQAGLLMEICERFSSWASIGPAGALAYRTPLSLVRARYSSVRHEALAPASLPLEVPDSDQILHWVRGTYPDGSPVLVPAQFVFLLANLDEPALCSGLGSTGLGAGLDMDRARVTALLEVIERDAESVTPHNTRRCFRLESRDGQRAALLDDFARRGIAVFFEDITPELGVPCYRAFVLGPEGQVVKGAAAGLHGPEACFSAMLEVPYPYPWGPPGRPAPEGLPVCVLEDLPDLSTGSFSGDLALLETALAASGRMPAYVDLTRADLDIPVCRAVVPGMELMADFDHNSRLSPRLFARLQQDVQGNTAVSL